jgi:protein-S-isoprenylcysteine O-methyltransferase Ste14
MSDIALRRINAFAWTYRIFFALALLLLAIGLFADHPTLVWLGILTAILTLLFISIGWLFVYPTGRFLDKDWISMSFVDKGFATSLERWYGGSPR